MCDIQHQEVGTTACHSAQYRVVVHNTFVNVVEASSSAGGRQSMLRAVRSDSFLCGQATHDRGAEYEFADVDAASSGFPCAVPCSLQQSPGPEEASVLSTTASDSGGGDEDDAASQDLPDAPTDPKMNTPSQCVAPGDLDAASLVVRENERLLQQNAALLEAVLQMQKRLLESSSLLLTGSGLARAPSQSCGPDPTWSPAEVLPRASPKRIPEDVLRQASGPHAACIDLSRTTVMLRNLPNNYTRTTLLELFESEGFGCEYTFLYLPIDFQTQSALGYAFVDFRNSSAVHRFWSVFDGFTNWSVPSRKSCSVSWCEPNQGLEAHIERYRNSPVMHDSVPDEYKPVLSVNGKRLPFPPPTKAIRAPRVRDCRRDYR